MHAILRVEAGQDIGITLPALRIGVLGRELQRVALVRMLDTDTTDQLPLVPSVFHHAIAGANALGRVVVQRVADVAVTTGRQKDLVEIVPVLTQVLRIARSRGGVESIFINIAVR